MELYNWAEKKFELQIAEIGSTFESRLNRLRFVNRVYRPFGSAYGFSRGFGIKLKRAIDI
jgi:hypothetical protein